MEIATLKYHRIVREVFFVETDDRETASSAITLFADLQNAGFFRDGVSVQPWEKDPDPDGKFRVRLQYEKDEGERSIALRFGEVE